MNNDSDQSIEALTKRIEALELDNKKLKRAVEQLRTAETKKSKPVISDKQHTTIQQEIYLDRNEREIELGDTVYIVTSGAHTNRSRTGTVTGFDWHRNRVFILDERKVTQERAPKNVRIVSKRTSKEA